MREILFRGKRVDNGEWVEGYYVKAEKLNRGGYEYFIIEESANGATHEITLETLGQYTGLTDNGTKIYEGDIVVVTDAYNNKVAYIVEYKPTAFGVTQLGVNYSTYLGDFDNGEYEIKVIGNIHDSLELLEGV